MVGLRLTAKHVEKSEQNHQNILVSSGRPPSLDSGGQRCDHNVSLEVTGKKEDLPTVTIETSSSGSVTGCARNWPPRGNQQNVSLFFCSFLPSVSDRISTKSF